ncbi:hypothetical protein CDLVIII_3794 [Clostridium sp. DL-VIII]|nr:hypothetical protein CDLVIII_3794 [Clostridium sp. DL-VIII]
MLWQKSFPIIKYYSINKIIDDSIVMSEIEEYDENNTIYNFTRYKLNLYSGYIFISINLEEEMITMIKLRFYIFKKSQLYYVILIIVNIIFTIYSVKKWWWDFERRNL